MMAWVELAGLTLSASGTSAWALRLGFIVLFGASTWLLARITTRSYGPRAGLLAAFALNVTGYYGLAAGTFALPDGPLLFFWLLTIDRLELALADRDSRRLKPWIWVGMAWGGAMLSKYHGVLIPLATALYVVLYRPMRRWFRKPGPYLGFGLGWWSSVRCYSGMPATAGRRFFSRAVGRSGAGRFGLITSPWPSWPRQPTFSRGSGDP